jgi:hypothetical protein
VIPLKTAAAAKSAGVALSKTTPMKVAHVKSASKTTVAHGAGISKPKAPSGTTISKTAVAVAAQKAGVLRISIGEKRSAVAASLAMKGKQVKVDVGAPSASATQIRLWCDLQL